MYGNGVPSGNANIGRTVSISLNNGQIGHTHNGSIQTTLSANISRTARTISNFKTGDVIPENKGSAGVYSSVLNAVLAQY